MNLQESLSSDHIKKKKKWAYVMRRNNHENHKANYQMGDIWRKRKTGWTRETLKRTLTRQDKMVDIESHDDSEKLASKDPQ